MEDLRTAELELSALRSEIAHLETGSEALNAEESAFWRSRNAFSIALEEFQNEWDEVNIKYDHDTKLLERLQRTNVYNDAFCISRDGFFGVINGLRLGRLPNKQVSIPASPSSPVPLLFHPPLVLLPFFLGVAS
jgi:beclin